MKRALRRFGVGLTAVAALLVIALALPVPMWRTGERPVPQLPLVDGGPAVRTVERVWIDTDAACGEVKVDPDDCFAILLLARSPRVRIVGISTVFGNAPIDATDRIARALVDSLQREGTPSIPVHRGAATPADAQRDAPSTAASAALQSALQEGPLVLLALGPLTNVASALRDRPDLERGVVRVIAVMGRRKGHLFHPAEGAGGAGFFGHGPIFTDFNFESDRAAAAAVLGAGLPMTLVPYEAARRLQVTHADLERLQSAGGTASWVSARSRGWLEYWRESMGRDGFYAFDLAAAAYVADPRQFSCANAEAWLVPERKLWDWFARSESLEVGLAREWPPAGRSLGEVVYCPKINEGAHPALLASLARDDR